MREADPLGDGRDLRGGAHSEAAVDRARREAPFKQVPKTLPTLHLYMCVSKEAKHTLIIGELLMFKKKEGKRN